MIYKDILVAFTRFGLLSYGGPSSIPLVQKEVVDVYGWMSTEEFGDVVAIANTLPGPILSKIVGYIGYKLAGIRGLALSLVALTLPTSTLMIVLMTILRHFSHYAWVRGMTRAVVPVVGVMLAVLAWQFISITAQELGWPLAAVHVVVVAVLISILGLHPVIIIAATILWALFGKTPERS